MEKFVIIILLVLLSFNSTISEGNSLQCNKAPLKSPLLRLKNYLLCGYDDNERPTHSGKNATNINLILIPTLSYFDEDTSNLQLHSLLFMEWIDERLKWNVSLFNDITEMPVSPYRIWIPEIAHRGAGSSDPNSDVYDVAQCYVSMRHNGQGHVSCMFSTVYNIRCETDFTRWPFDRQNCTLVIASWAHTDEEINMTEKSYDPVIIGEYRAGQKWQLDVARVSLDQKKSIYFENATTMALEIDFVLDRKTDFFRGQFVSPAIIMMVMTVITMYLEPRSIERFAIACSNIMIHLLSIQNLNWSLPHNGTTLPNILLFYCDSLVLAVTALLLTFALGKIETTKTCPPKWLASFVVKILKNKYGQAFLLSIFEIGDPRPAAQVEAEAEAETDDTSDALVNSDSDAKKLVWRYVTILFQRISYFIYIITYLIMYVALIHVSSIKIALTPIDGI